MLLRPSGRYMWLDPVKTSIQIFENLAGWCGDLISWSSKTSLFCKFPCLLNLHLPIRCGLPLSSISPCPLCTAANLWTDTWTGIVDYTLDKEHRNALEINNCTCQFCSFLTENATPMKKHSFTSGTRCSCSSDFCVLVSAFISFWFLPSQQSLLVVTGVPRANCLLFPCHLLFLFWLGWDNL